MPDIIAVEPARAAGINLEQYLGLWAIDDVQFCQLMEHASRIDLAAHIAANLNADVAAPRMAAASVGVTGSTANIAIVSIEGTMTKRGSSFSDAGSTTRLRQTIRQLAADPFIDGIMLKIDSPGGTVAGTSDLAAEVAAAAALKPVHAFIEDMTASAAYWVASQAQRVTANSPISLVGSIGTFVGLYDVSGAAAQQGIKAVVIKSGKFKAAGFPGTEITEEQKSVWQEVIDKTQSEFTAGVARGRGMSIEQAANLADGRSHVASDAMKLGLIDGISSFDAAMSELAAAAISKKPKGRKMSNSSDRVAASLSELKASCPGAEAAFLMDQLERGATAAEASKAWVETLNAKLEMRDQEIAELNEKLAAATATKPGVKAVPTAPAAGTVTESTSAHEEHEAAVKELMAAGKSRSAANAEVFRKNPELRERLVQEANAKQRSR